MSLLIKDPEADRIVRELAARTGETLTEAVKTAARERLERLPSPPTRKGRIDHKELERVLAEIRSYPVTNADLTDDEIIGYNENGVPN